MTITCQLLHACNNNDCCIIFFFIWCLFRSDTVRKCALRSMGILSIRFPRRFQVMKYFDSIQRWKWMFIGHFCRTNKDDIDCSQRFFGARSIFFREGRMEKVPRKIHPPPPIPPTPNEGGGLRINVKTIRRNLADNTNRVLFSGTWFSSLRMTRRHRGSQKRFISPQSDVKRCDTIFWSTFLYRPAILNVFFSDEMKYTYCIHVCTILYVPRCTYKHIYVSLSSRKKNKQRAESYNVY